MSKTYTVTTPVQINGKTSFNPVGVAVLQRKGAKSFMKLKLSTAPINGELVLFEPSNRNDADGPEKK